MYTPVPVNIFVAVTKYMTKISRGGRRFWRKFEGTTHHLREAMAAGSWGRWSSDICSQEAERDGECQRSAQFPFFFCLDLQTMEEYNQHLEWLFVP